MSKINTIMSFVVLIQVIKLYVRKFVYIPISLPGFKVFSLFCNTSRKTYLYMQKKKSTHYVVNWLIRLRAVSLYRRKKKHIMHTTTMAQTAIRQLYIVAYCNNLTDDLTNLFSRRAFRENHIKNSVVVTVVVTGLSQTTSVCIFI